MSSWACSLLLTGTTQTPACQQANITSMYSALFFATIATRSPGASPAVRKALARQRTRAANAP